MYGEGLNLVFDLAFIAIGMIAGAMISLTLWVVIPAGEWMIYIVIIGGVIGFFCGKWVREDK